MLALKRFGSVLGTALFYTLCTAVWIYWAAVLLAMVAVAFVIVLLLAPLVD